MATKYNFTESELHELGITADPGFISWLNQCSFDFPADIAYLTVLMFDDSGSMASYRDTVRKFMRILVEEKYSERASMMISLSFFSGADNIYVAPVESIDGVTKKIDIVTKKYTANGGRTAFYDAVHVACKYMLNYIRVLQAKFNLEVKGLFMALSDGDDNESKASSAYSVPAEIRKLHREGVDTVFVPFGNAINASLGHRLGFQQTTQVDKNHQALLECSRAMSRRMDEGSKQLGSSSLGANPASAMFSEALKSQAAGIGASGAIAQNPGAFPSGKRRFRRGGKI